MTRFGPRTPGECANYYATVAGTFFTKNTLFKVNYEGIRTITASRLNTHYLELGNGRYKIFIPTYMYKV